MFVLVEVEIRFGVGSFEVDVWFRFLRVRWVAGLIVVVVRSRRFKVFFEVVLRGVDF